MPFINVNQLTKNYKIFEKEDGVIGSIKGLFVRKYKNVEAVNNISFSIEEGDIVGYIGANGAGKTTTLKMLSGLIRPTSGTIKIGEFIPSERKNEFKKMFALVMGQKNQLWWDIPAKESFELFRAIYEVDRKTYKKRMEMLVDLLEVGDLLDKPVRNLSLGERMKMEIIGSLIHNPRILFLDEPTIGLDIISQKKIRCFLKEINKEEKTTIILTSHYMKDIEELCNKLLIINKGSVVYDGSVEHIKSVYSSERNIIFTYNGEVPEEEINKYGRVIQLSDGKAEIIVDAKDVTSVQKELVSKFEILNFRAEEADIENAVVKLFLSNDSPSIKEEVK